MFNLVGITFEKKLGWHKHVTVSAATVVKKIGFYKSSMCFKFGQISNTGRTYRGLVAQLHFYDFKKVKYSWT